MTTAPDLRDMLIRTARILANDLEGVSATHWWWAERRRLLAEVKALLAAPAADAYQATYTAQPGYQELLAFTRAYHGAIAPERELAAMAASALAVVDGRPAPASERWHGGRVAGSPGQGAPGCAVLRIVAAPGGYGDGGMAGDRG